MLQKLLAARFGLVIHHDKRELGVRSSPYRWKGGPKLEKSKGDPDALSDQFEDPHGVGPAQYMKFTERHDARLRPATCS